LKPIIETDAYRITLSLSGLNNEVVDIRYYLHEEITVYTWRITQIKQGVYGCIRLHGYYCIIIITLYLGKNLLNNA